MQKTENLWKTLPKIELHTHLGGAARPKTIQQMLILNGMNEEKATQKACEMVIPKDKDGVLHEPPNYHGFEIIQEGWNGSLLLLKQILNEHLEDLIEDGCYYIELRTGGANFHKLITILNAIDDFSLRQKEKKENGIHTGSFIQARLIVSIKRDEDIEVAWQSVKNAVKLKDRGVQAIDVCGVDPWLYPLSPQLIKVIQWAQQEGGLRFVPHFAESAGEKDLQSILSLNPLRLGHAVHLDWEYNLKEDSLISDDSDSDLRRITKEVKEKRIVIECCLSSNLNTMRRDGHLPPYLVGGMVEATMHHPLLQMWRINHPFVLCTDNLGLLQTPLSEIYRIAATAIFRDLSSRQPNVHEKQLMSVESIGWMLSFNAVEESHLENDVKIRIKEALTQHPWALS
jgi:adenosine deaminase